MAILTYQEVNKDYKRAIYKEDLPKLNKKLKVADSKEAEAMGTTRKSRTNAPSKGLALSFVHG